MQSISVPKRAKRKPKLLAFPLSPDVAFSNLVDAVSILENPAPFCEEGTLKAMIWMRTASQVVEVCQTADSERLRLAVYVALEELLEHRADCTGCR